jgi:hypothetical protein
MMTSDPQQLELFSKHVSSLSRKLDRHPSGDVPIITPLPSADVRHGCHPSIMRDNAFQGAFFS